MCLSHVFLYYWVQEQMIAQIKKFSNDVVAEMKKVSWPSKDQLKESTTVVISVTGILTAVVFIVDWVFSSLITLVF